MIDHDRRTPLDAGEQAIARVLRALPAGDPPSSLDARILSMARDAVVGAPDQPDEATPRRRRHWVGRVGLAAGLLVATGLVWRLGDRDRSPPPPPPEAALDPATAQAPEAWIAGIREARDAGDLEKARRELGAFLDAHPGHPLPEDLATLREGP